MCNGDAGPVGLLGSRWGLLPLGLCILGLCILGLCVVGLCMGELSELKVEPSKNAGGTPRIIAEAGSSGADQT